MCGIAGILGNSLLVRQTAGDLYRKVSLMVDALHHRGPDDMGMWSDEKDEIFLGHTRLSIIDLTPAGHQPMFSHSGGSCIVFNGEIYNYVELRSLLESKGIVFKSKSDTEVIPVLYELYGYDLFNYLHGMFAFALWDRKAKRLILARDRIGKKPLYYIFHNNILYFASEIKSIKNIFEPSDLILDEIALDEYLTFGFISGDRTIYKGIREVLPGHYLMVDKNLQYESVCYWEPKYSPKRNVDFVEALEEIEEILSDAIRIRLRADVKIGVFLSGGIDSGLITAIASKYSSNSSTTFSIGFKHNRFDERPLARLVAERYNTNHYEEVIEPDIVSLLPEIVQAYDEPFADASAIPTFYIAKTASKYLKVILNGDGGDEFFGGYRRYIAGALYENFSQYFHNNTIRKIAKMVLNMLPIPRSYRTAYAFIFRFLRGISESASDCMISWLSDGFSPVEKEKLYKELPEIDFAKNRINSLIEKMRNLDLTEQLMVLDQIWMLPDDLLVKMDMATMHYGLEARSPFLDHRLIEFSNMLPSDMKIRGLTTKALLRELGKQYLPEAIVNAPKRGFEIPLYDWLNNELKELRDDMILSSSGIIAAYFNRKFLDNLLKGRIPVEPSRWAQLVWTLLVLSLWDKYCNRAYDKRRGC